MLVNCMIMFKMVQRSYCVNWIQSRFNYHSRRDVIPATLTLTKVSEKQNIAEQFVNDWSLCVCVCVCVCVMYKLKLRVSNYHQ